MPITETKCLAQSNGNANLPVRRHRYCYRAEIPRQLILSIQAHASLRILQMGSLSRSNMRTSPHIPTSLENPNSSSRPRQRAMSAIGAKRTLAKQLLGLVDSGTVTRPYVFQCLFWACPTVCNAVSHIVAPVP